MASFGWKRKVGEKVSKSVVQKFEAEVESVGGENPCPDEEVDWLHAIKRRKELLLEDCVAKSQRLKDEGSVLVEQGRHWEAVKKWDEAIQLSPDNHLLYEMKSQVLTILHEVFPAVQAAEMAVKLHPLWWEGWQTLGRAQLNLGEVDLALRSFQVAVHLCPSDRSLWQEDLVWAQRLKKQHLAAKEKKSQEEEARNQLLSDPDPDPEQDYDFDSDEVLAACVAAAERQRKYEEMMRTDEDKKVNVLTEDGDSLDGASPSNEQLVKVRGL